MPRPSPSMPSATEKNSPWPPPNSTATAPPPPTMSAGWKIILPPCRPNGWARAPKDPPRIRDGATGHVFLVGFPRSGTTLLENILASHPGVAALDERDTLGEAAREFLASDEGRDRLAALTPAEIEKHRAIYWQRVRGFGADVTGRVFLDKYPLSSIKLPLVAKLFPDARILFAIRDPRDVLFSCFRRSFSLNTSMFELLDLERGARFYAAVMDLAAVYRDKLDLAWHPLRYESLVADFEGEMRGVCDFIGVAWNEQMRDFAERPKSRTIKTPSSTQVVRGLYREGAGQWRNYESELAPALPILAPWIGRPRLHLGSDRRNRSTSTPTSKLAAPVRAPPGIKQRIPDIEDQHRARLVAAVPGFVLDGIVEHQRLAFPPFARLVAHPEPAAFRHDQGQMHDHPRVGDAGVRRDQGLRLQAGEKSGRRDPRHLGQRQPRQQRRGLGTLGNMVFDGVAVLPEEIGAPFGRVVEFSPLVQRGTLVGMTRR